MDNFLLIKINKFSMIPDGIGKSPVREGPGRPAPSGQGGRRDALWVRAYPVDRAPENLYLLRVGRRKRRP